jgi:chemotaxis protein CheX
MKAEFINPFLSAAVNVFKTMLGHDLTRGELSVAHTHTPTHEISGLIGLTGNCQGMVVLSVGRSTAICATEILVGKRPEGINADVVDAGGELTNMIAGAAKVKLEKYCLSIGLPTVICGKTTSISFPSHSLPIIIPFSSDIGPVTVEVGLSEVTTSNSVTPNP